MADLAIITPTFGPVGTGSATYYRLLAQALAGKGVEVAVVSERGTRPDRRRPGVDPLVVELLPRRTARAKGRVTAPLLYAVQNLTYLGLPRVLEGLKPKAVLVHSSFFNWPTLLRAPLLASRRATGARFVLDVRDRLLSSKRDVESVAFDDVIACSENALAHLRGLGATRRIAHIPIPQEPLAVGLADVEAFKARYGLRRPYVLYAGLVKELKRVDLLLETFNDHLRPVMPEVELVVAGMLKTSRPTVLRGLKRPGVRFVGPLARREVLAAMGGASLVANLSPNEGMPRSSLEALALGARVALPPNVPEFERHCREAVIVEREPGAVADRFQALLREPPVRYPVARHDPRRVVDEYVELLFGDPAIRRKRPARDPR